MLLLPLCGLPLDAQSFKFFIKSGLFFLLLPVPLVSPPRNRCRVRCHGAGIVGQWVKLGRDIRTHHQKAADDCAVGWAPAARVGDPARTSRSGYCPSVRSEATASWPPDRAVVLVKARLPERVWLR